MNPRAVRVWSGLAVAVVALLIGQQVWHWEVERIEVPPGNSLVRIHLWGTALPAGEMIVPETLDGADSYKGIQERMLTEGRHFLNPLFWDTKPVPMVEVPAGQCAVLTRKFGKELTPERLAAGDALAGDGERGIVREVKLPGRHRINPHAYAWELKPAVEITSSEVGVRTLKIGNDPATLPKQAGRSPYVVPVGYRGVQQDLRPPGTYYVNPYVEEIVPVKVRDERVEFSDIEFPSRDGFTLRPKMQVTYRVEPEKAPQLFVLLTEKGRLHQESATPEQQARNEILRKIILPLIRGYARIEGSKFEARDFIAASGKAGETTNARERLRKNLEDKLRERCVEYGIAVTSLGLLDQMNPPPELSQQIYERKEATAKRDTNLSRIAQYKTDQELKATEALKQQEQEKVEARTRLIQAETRAGQRKQVEEAKLRQELANAQLRLDGAKATAKAVLTTGKAEADVIQLQNEADVSGMRKAIQGFQSPEAYAQFQVLSKIAPALSEIFASDTSDFAKLFTAYMTPPKASNGKPPAVAVTPTSGSGTAP